MRTSIKPITVLQNMNMVIKNPVDAHLMMPEKKMPQSTNCETSFGDMLRLSCGHMLHGTTLRCVILSFQTYFLYFRCKTSNYIHIRNKK